MIHAEDSIYSCRSLQSLTSFIVGSYRMLQLNLAIITVGILLVQV